MYNSLKDRIKYLLRIKNVTILELAGSENQRVKLSRQLNKDNAEVTTYTIDLILRTFPDISSEWLLRGEGSMDKVEHIAPRIIAHDGATVNTGSASNHSSISINAAPASPYVIGSGTTVPSCRSLGLDISDPLTRTRLECIFAQYEEAIHARNIQIDSLTHDKSVLESLLSALTCHTKKETK